LALLGDKRILMNAQETGFVMYSVHGRSWISMRDPVGPRNQLPELAWSFRSMVDEHAGWPVFYQVGEENLPMYIDQELTLLKLGEEARVPLVEFTMEGPERRSLRRTYSRLQRLGCSFDVVEPQDVVPLLPELREISSAWLQNKGSNEKGLFAGLFRRIVSDALSVRDCAFERPHHGVHEPLVQRGARRSDGGPDAVPTGRSFAHDGILADRIDSLGAAARLPLVQSRDGSPLGYLRPAVGPVVEPRGGTRLRHGETLYNFEGLREFKERFAPVWAPKYLATPGGWALPRILADVALLIARRPPGSPDFRRSAAKNARRTAVVLPADAEDAVGVADPLVYTG